MLTKAFSFTVTAIGTFANEKVGSLQLPVPSSVKSVWLNSTSIRHSNQATHSTPSGAQPPTSLSQLDKGELLSNDLKLDDAWREPPIATVSANSFAANGPGVKHSHSPSFFSRMQWGSLSLVLLTSLLSISGFLTTPLRKETVVFSFCYLWFTVIGITAGYHRLWSHRSYKASGSLAFLLAIAGAASIQGSIQSWTSRHCGHHRSSNADLDMHCMNEGFWSAHVGWMLDDSQRPQRQAEEQNQKLSESRIVMWQSKHYSTVAFLFGIILPWSIVGLLWKDWRGGLFFAVCSRIVAGHHLTSFMTSIAHLWREAPLCVSHTLKDNFITSIITLGDGFHDFHQQFPTDYRNSETWYHFDPTKWIIVLFEWLGLATDLQRFSTNEIRKARFATEAKKLFEIQEGLVWARKRDELPLMDWSTFQQESEVRPLVIVAGFVHDVSSMIDYHPGGRALLAAALGKDATVPFFGGVYEHSNGAMNLLSTMRIAALEKGHDTIHLNAPSHIRRLYVAERRWDD